MKPVIVPHDQLSGEALNGVIEEFVTRDGTDYGVREVTLDEKIARVKRLLETGKAVIVFDPESQSCNILPGSDPAVSSL